MECNSSVDELSQRHGRRLKLVDNLKPVTDSCSAEGSGAFAATLVGGKHPVDATSSSGFRQ